MPVVMLDVPPEVEVGPRGWSSITIGGRVYPLETEWLRRLGEEIGHALTEARLAEPAGVPVGPDCVAGEG